MILPKAIRTLLVTMAIVSPYSYAQESGLEEFKPKEFVLQHDGSKEVSSV
jgi:hypothetical protein